MGRGSWAVLAALAAAGPLAGAPAPWEDNPKAVAALKKARVLLTHDEERPGRPVVAADFRLLSFLSKPDTPLEDLAPLEHLAGLKSLRHLDLSVTKLDDRGPGGAAVTDAGLRHLVRLNALRELSLNGTGVTDAGLKQLAGLKGLRSLDLRGTKVRGAGLKHLAGLGALRELDLAANAVDDAGLKHLAGLGALETLELRQTKVTEKGKDVLRKALPDCRVY